MDGSQGNSTPLNELAQALPVDDFANAIAQRYREGAAQEVEAYLRGAPRDALIPLSNIYDERAPWFDDFDLRWRLGPLFNRHRLTLKGSRESARTDAAFSADVEALIQWLLDDADASERRDMASFIVNHWIAALNYPGMSRDEAMRLIRKARDIRLIAERIPGRGADMDEAPLLKHLTRTEDLIEVAQIDDYLARAAMAEHACRTDAKKTIRRWRDWMDFFTRCPKAIDVRVIHDPWVLEIYWGHANDEQRQLAAYFFLGTLALCEAKEWPECAEVFDRVVRRAPEAFAYSLRENGAQLSKLVADKIWSERYPLLVPELLPSMAESYSPKHFRELLERMLGEQPQLLEALPAVKLVKLLPALSAKTLKGVLVSLANVVASSSSRQLREALVARAADLQPEDLREAGWLALKNKNLQQALREILLASPHPLAREMLQAMLGGGKLDAASTSVIEAHLGVAPAKAADNSAAPSPAAELAAVEQQAATVKRIAAAVRAFDVPQVLDTLQPLSEHAARVVLHLAAGAEGEFPPLLARMLALVPDEGRARLSMALVEVWVALEGEPKARWALRLAYGNSDDRVVDSLAQAALAWGKPRKQRAVLAVEQLGALDTLYALARIQEIGASRKVKDAVIYAARQALRSAAERRGISVADLHDELTPDFGLARGVELSVGERRYRVELQGDLSLRLVDEKGKVSKSLPALKDETLRAAWEDASTRYKALADGLKAVLKQQAPRMQAAFYTGKTWPAARWQRLFLEHPLLRIAGRSLIWRSESASGKALASFRIAEDFSLLDVDDNAVSLPDDACVGLWHPATAQAGEAEAWKANLADYRIEAMVDQVGAGAELPAAAQIRDKRLMAPEKLVVTQGRLSGLLKKWGYRGTTGDSSSIHEHDWSLPAAGLMVRLHHSRVEPFMVLDNPVTIEGFEILQRKEYWDTVNPAKLPKPLLATLMSQLRRLEEAVKAG